MWISLLFSSTEWIRIRTGTQTKANETGGSCCPSAVWLQSPALKEKAQPCETNAHSFYRQTCLSRQSRQEAKPTTDLPICLFNGGFDEAIYNLRGNNPTRVKSLYEGSVFGAESSLWCRNRPQNRGTLAQISSERNRAPSHRGESVMSNQ
ncbi:hypothetical protein MHYP_G00195780 [Metynnis hypsauchen]